MSSFVVENAPLRELADRVAGSRRVVALVPSTDITLSQVELPVRQAAKALAAIPFSLEDQLADDIDDLHFSLGVRTADGYWPVAVVAHERMREWHALFVDCGLKVDAVVPDLLCLPIPEHGHAVVLVDGDEAIVRTGVGSGFVCMLDSLELCLDVIDPDRTLALRTMICRDTVLDPSTWTRPCEVLHGFDSPLAALLPAIKSSQPIDLLQNVYSPQQDWLRYVRPWRVAAALAALCVLLGLFYHAWSGYRLGRELTALDTANVERYQQVFPAETRIVDLSAQLQQQLSKLSGGSSGPAFFPLMQVLTETIGGVPGLETRTVQYRDGSMYVGFKGENLQTLEQLKAWFEQPRGATLEVQSANAGSDGVQIRIRLVPA